MKRQTYRSLSRLLILIMVLCLLGSEALPGIFPQISGTVRWVMMITGILCGVLSAAANSKARSDN